MTPGLPRQWRTPVLAAGAILLVLLLFTVWGRIHAAAVLDGVDLARRTDVAVLLDFEPELFHIKAFQRVGRYQGWSDGRARIMSADPAALRRLARNYWVRRVEPLGGGA